jgi:hypothetical protein
MSNRDGEKFGLIDRDNSSDEENMEFIEEKKQD